MFMKKFILKLKGVTDFPEVFSVQLGAGNIQLVAIHREWAGEKWEACVQILVLFLTINVHVPSSIKPWSSSKYDECM